MIYYDVQLSRDGRLTWLQKDGDGGWQRGQRLLKTAAEVRRVQDHWPSEYIDLLVSDEPPVPVAGSEAWLTRQ